MADKTAEQKEVESTAEEVENTKQEESGAEEETKSENGSSKENGEQNEKENGQGEGDVKKDDEDSTDKVCSVKRKSAGGDAPECTPSEGATPEKKAKLAETAEAESNGEAEVAA